MEERTDKAVNIQSSFYHFLRMRVTKKIERALLTLTPHEDGRAELTTYL